jgi:uncharacterized protein (DUF2252 family)
MIERIRKFNANRLPKMLKLKYAGMSESAFRFYRGSCHLFYEDLPTSTDLDLCPIAWVCGDLHLENFGSFKADNDLEYFDINDFDESALAPCLYDVARLLVSVIIAAEELLQTSELAAIELCRSFLNNYTESLKYGHSSMIEKRTAQGLIKDFLKTVGKRKNIELLEKRTEKKNGKRKLIIDDNKVFSVDEDKKEQIAFILEKWAKRTPKKEDFYKVIDVGYRIAGTGSLGLERYVVLVEGEGSPNHNVLLDLKIAQTSALLPHLNTPQPQWENEALRIIAIQRRMQAFSPALLSSIDLDGVSYILKKLQPSDDKMNLELCKGKMSKLDEVLNIFAQITAYAHLRGSGRQGSGIADEFIDFAEKITWQKPLMEYVKYYAKQVQKDYKIYYEAYKDGVFDVEN